jgi:hypothetical protein
VEVAPPQAALTDGSHGAWQVPLMQLPGLPPQSASVMHVADKKMQQSGSTEQRSGLQGSYVLSLSG